MGTKNKPGDYDCYKNADPDEPMFILLARDPSAPLLVELWARMKVDADPGEEAMEIEAMECARAMREWREKHRPGKHLRVVRNKPIPVGLPDEETPKEKKKITSAEFWGKVDEAGPMRAVRMVELYEEYDIENEDEEATERRKKSTAEEKQAHPDWWTITVDVADSNESKPRQRMVRMKMPPFDTFAFDGVSDVLRSTGRTLEDYKDGYCTLAVIVYQNIFPILSSKGYKLSPAP